MARALALIYGLVCYTVFLLTFLYAIAFVGNLQSLGSMELVLGGTDLVSNTIDSASNTASSTGMALLINLLLLSVFALPHSVMARPGFKAVWTKIVPKPVERSTYVLVSSLALILIYSFWVPMTDAVWTATGSLATVLTILFYAGFGIVLLSTFMINHFDLFGLKQVVENMTRKSDGGSQFVTRGLYNLCRHPIMLGFVIAFWATPSMTMGHLLFAAVTTAYILVALIFEEKDLVSEFGDAYRQYQRSTPKLIPTGGLGRSKAASQPADRTPMGD